MTTPLAPRNYIHIGAETESFLPVPQPSCNSTLWSYLIGQGYNEFNFAASHLKELLVTVPSNNYPPFFRREAMKRVIDVLIFFAPQPEGEAGERVRRHVQTYAYALLLNEYASLAFFNSDLRLYEGFVDCKRSGGLLELVRRRLHEEDFSLKGTRIEITDVGLEKLKNAIKQSVSTVLHIKDKDVRVSKNISLLQGCVNDDIVALETHGKWVNFRRNDTLKAVVIENLDPEAYSIFSDIIQISSTGLEALYQELCAKPQAARLAASNAQSLSEYVAPHKLEVEFLPEAISCNNFPPLEAFVRENLAQRHFKADGEKIEISNIGLHILCKIIQNEHTRIIHANREIKDLLGPNSFCFECRGFGKCELGYLEESQTPIEDGHNLLSIAAECGYEMTGFSITSSERDRRQWSIENSTKAALPIAERREQNCHIVTDMKGVKNFLWKLYEIDTSGFRDYIRPLGSDFSA